ncbi:MAG: hypothetical protein ACYSW3_00175 [Planctomycetota bacterium]|jgi:hypothetical protein
MVSIQKDWRHDWGYLGVNPETGNWDDAMWYKFHAGPDLDAYFVRGNPVNNWNAAALSFAKTQVGIQRAQLDDEDIRDTHELGTVYELDDGKISIQYLNSTNVFRTLIMGPRDREHLHAEDFDYITQSKIATEYYLCFDVYEAAGGGGHVGIVCSSSFNKIAPPYSPWYHGSGIPKSKGHWWRACSPNAGPTSEYPVCSDPYPENEVVTLAVNHTMTDDGSYIVEYFQELPPHHSTMYREPDWCKVGDCDNAWLIPGTVGHVWSSGWNDWVDYVYTAQPEGHLCYACHTAGDAWFYYGYDYRSGICGPRDDGLVYKMVSWYVDDSGNHMPNRCHDCYEVGRTEDMYIWKKISVNECGVGHWNANAGTHDYHGFGWAINLHPDIHWVAGDTFCTYGHPPYEMKDYCPSHTDIGWFHFVAGGYTRTFQWRQGTTLSFTALAGTRGKKLPFHEINSSYDEATGLSYIQYAEIGDTLPNPGKRIHYDNPGKLPNWLGGVIGRMEQDEFPCTTSSTFYYWPPCQSYGPYPCGEDCWCKCEAGPYDTHCEWWHQCREYMWISNEDYEKRGWAKEYFEVNGQTFLNHSWNRANWLPPRQVFMQHPRMFQNGTGGNQITVSCPIRWPENYDYNGSWTVEAHVFHNGSWWHNKNYYQGPRSRTVYSTPCVPLDDGGAMSGYFGTEVCTSFFNTYMFRSVRYNFLELLHSGDPIRDGLGARDLTALGRPGS